MTPSPSPVKVRQKALLDLFKYVDITRAIGKHTQVKVGIGNDVEEGKRKREQCTLEVGQCQCRKDEDIILERVLK